jgi:splicing factor 45
MNTHTPYTPTHTSKHTLKFLQINLHHSKAATAALCQQLTEGNADVALIQEPWLYSGRIKGLTNTGGTVYSAAPCNNIRSCTYIWSLINALPLLEFCSRDTTMVRITHAYGGIHEELIVTSAYLPYYSDEPPPNKEVRDVIELSHNRKKQLIIRCDAKAHHTLWGSTSTNPRGESLMEGISGEFKPDYFKPW